MNHSLLCLPLLYALCYIKGARILGIFPTQSVRQQAPFQAIMKVLAAIEQQVTVVSTQSINL
jgi:hypothetical protein